MFNDSNTNSNNNNDYCLIGQALIVIITTIIIRGLHWYSCDVSGQNGNQQYHLRDDGRLEKMEPGMIMIMITMITN